MNKFFEWIFRIFFWIEWFSSAIQCLNEYSKSIAQGYSWERNCNWDLSQNWVERPDKLYWVVLPGTEQTGWAFFWSHTFAFQYPNPPNPCPCQIAGLYISPFYWKPPKHHKLESVHLLVGFWMQQSGGDQKASCWYHSWHGSAWVDLMGYCLTEHLYLGPQRENPDTYIIL